jgi:hypothetical protein
VPERSAAHFVHIALATEAEKSLSKYLWKSCPIFRHVATTVNLPALPRTSPQIHHKRTTRKTSFSQNPYQKHGEIRLFHHQRRPPFFPEN